MRATLFLLFSLFFLALFLWVGLSGIFFALGCAFFMVLVVMTFGYSDTSILFFLGAREVRSADESIFFEAASQEAYKLSISLPHLYIYNGSLERGFVFQNKQTISLVLGRTLLENAHPSELSAICFELLLQVKRGMAPKRTKVMFLLGFNSWILHAVMGLLMFMIPHKDVKLAVSWFGNYLLYPWMNFLFHILLGKSYFKRLRSIISDFPLEQEQLRRVGLKLRKPLEIYSLPSKKLMELSSVSRSRHFQNILALELLPHEWDFFFDPQEINSASKV